jgi:hypothetical protein
VLRFICTQTGVHLLTLLKRVSLLDLCVFRCVSDTVSTYFSSRRWSWDIAVGILTRLRTRQPSSHGSFSKVFSSALKLTVHSIRWVTGALSPRLKQPARASDYSSPSSMEV